MCWKANLSGRFIILGTPMGGDVSEKLSMSKIYGEHIYIYTYTKIPRMRCIYNDFIVGKMYIVYAVLWMCNVCIMYIRFVMYKYFWFMDLCIGAVERESC